MAVTEAAIPEFTIGDRLAKAREFAGLSQDDMAERFGNSRATISTWERGESQPRKMLEVVDRWSEVTGVDRAWILGVRTGSFSTPCLELIENEGPVAMTLPFDRHLTAV